MVSRSNSESESMRKDGYNSRDNNNTTEIKEADIVKPVFLIVGGSVRMPRFLLSTCISYLVLGNCVITEQ